MLVEMKNVEKTFFQGSYSLTILQNLDFCLEKGQKVCITGSSGSGKSTLLNMIGGIDTATKGKITVANYDMTNATQQMLCEYHSCFLGLVFQFHYLLNDFSALENVFLPALIKGTQKKKAVQKAEELLCDVGLKDRFHHLPCQLSGGERQRVAVARSLVNDPQLILADEPTGNLDPQNASLIGDLLFSLCDKYQKTLLLVTHDMSLAKKASCIFQIQNKHLVKVN